jgi:hypothetical protein
VDGGQRRDGVTSRAARGCVGRCKASAVSDGAWPTVVHPFSRCRSFIRGPADRSSSGPRAGRKSAPARVVPIHPPRVSPLCRSGGCDPGERAPVTRRVEVPQRAVILTPRRIPPTPSAMNALVGGHCTVSALTQDPADLQGPVRQRDVLPALEHSLPLVRTQAEPNRHRGHRAGTSAEWVTGQPAERRGDDLWKGRHPYQIGRRSRRRVRHRVST